MNIFKRLLKIGQAEINSFIEKMEDPIRMTEQGIRELRDDLDINMEILARVKAQAIRFKNEIESKIEIAKEFENKAILILSKAQKGEIDLTIAEKMAKEGLEQKKNALKDTEKLQKELDEQEEKLFEMEKNVDVIKFNIHKWENELKILKARVKVNKATHEVNKQMAYMDNESTIQLLERMKQKAAEEEALSEAYEEIAKTNKAANSNTDEIENNKDSEIEIELEKIKKELGIN